MTAPLARPVGGRLAALPAHAWAEARLTRVRAVGRAACQGLAILLISLVLSEFALRVYDYFNPVFVFYGPSYDRFRLRPHSLDWGFPLNSGGFKDEEFAPKAPGTYRILGLGDSFAFGVVPYADNYLTLLQQRLAQRSPTTEVLNLGIPATGPREYLTLLVREGLALEPDAVLVSFFVGNDFTESRREERPLYSHSYVASLADYVFRVLPNYQGPSKRRRARAEFTEYCDDCPNLADQAYMEIEGRRSRIYIEQQRNYLLGLLDDAAHHLAGIRDLCEKRGIPMVVAIIPDEVQLNAELQRRVRENFFPELTWNNTQPNTLLGERLEQLGIPYIDLYQDFAAEAPSAALYRPRDSHWNVRGNHLAAEVIGRELARSSPVELAAASPTHPQRRS